MTKKELKSEIDFLKKEIIAIYTFLNVKEEVKKEVARDIEFDMFSSVPCYGEYYVKKTLVLVKKIKK
jgi:hypothetical protein